MAGICVQIVKRGAERHILAVRQPTTRWRMLDETATISFRGSRGFLFEFLQ